jgi:hypothetical protein
VEIFLQVESFARAAFADRAKVSSGARIVMTDSASIPEKQLQGRSSMSAILTSSSADGERRQTERKPLSVRVRFTLAGKPEMEVRSVDISPTGMSVVVDLNLVPSTTCNVAFGLPQADGSPHKVALSASVAHCTYSGQRSGFVIGLQFKNVPPDTQAALARYVKG